MQPSQRLAARPVERRRHQRVKVVLMGRFMLQNQREYPCQTIDISPGGVAVRAPVLGRVGERIVLYLEQIGRIEGQISRLLDDGFAVSCSATRHKQEKLANQLTWLANRDILGLPEDRRHERVVPRNTRSLLRIEDGREYIVRLIDVSRSGAAVATTLSPPLGSSVVIGKTEARVARHFKGGIGVEFKSPLDQPDLDDSIEI